MAFVKFLAGNEDAVKAFVAREFPQFESFSRASRAVGFVEALGTGWELTGGVILAPRGGGFDAELAIVIRKGSALSRGQLRDLFGVAFGTFKLARLTCHVATDNMRSCSMVERLGFRKEGVLRRGFDGERDAVVYGMTADKCRWVNARR